MLPGPATSSYSSISRYANAITAKHEDHYCGRYVQWALTMIILYPWN